MNFDGWKAWSWHTLTGISSFQPQLITLIYWSLKLFFQLIWYTDVLLQKKSITKLWSVWWNLSIIFLIFQCRYVHCTVWTINDCQRKPPESQMTGNFFSEALIQIVHWITSSIHENYKLRTWGEQVVFVNCSECQNINKKKFVCTTCSHHVLSL